MFTGIIEEIGTIKDFKKGATDALIVVECNKVICLSSSSRVEEAVKIGDSIAINGVCQTVTALSPNSFSAQISLETLKATNFSSFKNGDKVNLERALAFNGRLGGHIVTGHVDGLAKVKTIHKLSDFYNLKFQVEKDLAKYIAQKGSVTINGVSLTVAEITGNEFNIAIIPHTFENTTLKDIKIGDYVNLETDILAKYVEKFLSTDNNSVIDENFLKANGFF